MDKSKWVWIRPFSAWNQWKEATGGVTCKANAWQYGYRNYKKWPSFQKQRHAFVYTLIGTEQTCTTCDPPGWTEPTSTVWGSLLGMDKSPVLADCLGLQKEGSCQAAGRPQCMASWWAASCHVLCRPETDDKYHCQPVYLWIIKLKAFIIVVWIKALTLCVCEVFLF